MDAIVEIAPCLIRTNLKLSLNDGCRFDIRFGPSAAPLAPLSMHVEMPMLAQAA